MKTLNELIECFKEKLSQGNSLIDLQYVLKEYDGDDWQIYKEFCKQGYKRNLVYRDELFEILVICWCDGQSSGVHDHPENGCLLKVVQGELIEEEYINGETEPIAINILRGDEVSYKISDKILHNIKNKSGRCAISLHIYAPPNYRPNFYS